MKGQIDARLLVLAPIIILVVVLATSVVAIVPAGSRGVLLEWGAVNQVPLGEGLHFITPVANKVEMMSVQTMKYETSASAATKDLMDVQTTVAVNYHLDPSQASLMYQEVGKEYQDRLIVPAVQEVVKAVTAKYDAKELITNRDNVKIQIDTFLRERLVSRGIIVETTSITNFNFPQTFNDAITAAQTSTQQAIKAQNDLERIKFEAEQKVAAANGEADAKLAVATAEAQALRIQGQAIRENPEVVQLRWIDKWQGNVPTIQAGNNMLPILNIPTQAVV
jgi:prohibitin 2